MKSLLVITHNTGLTGAPKSLLLILEQLYNQNFEITTIAIEGNGKLENQFKKISKNFFNLQEFENTVIYNFKNRVKRIIFKKPIISKRQELINYINSSNYNYIYLNTVNSLKLGIRFFCKENIPTILHIHELKTVIDEFVPNLKEFENEITHYIVPSELNKLTLINDYKIQSNKISIVRETSILKPTIRKKIKNENKIVLMCGGAYWRKGDDLFIQIASKVLHKNKNIEFYWVGNISQERLRVNLADAEKLLINDNIHFIEESLDIEYWLDQASIFLLPSREDPFPLAAIEAGMSGLPILCFNKATGITEVINKECCIPYLDVQIMADKILELFEDENKRNKIGEENKVFFSSLTPKNISDEIIKILENQ